MSASAIFRSRYWPAQGCDGRFELLAEITIGGIGDFRRHAFGNAAPFGDFGIAADDFEAGIDQVDAVEQGLQFGRLVDDMHRRGHLPQSWSSAAMRSS